MPILFRTKSGLNQGPSDIHRFHHFFEAETYYLSIQLKSSISSVNLKANEEKCKDKATYTTRNVMIIWSWTGRLPDVPKR